MSAEPTARQEPPRHHASAGAAVDEQQLLYRMALDAACIGIWHRDLADHSVRISPTLAQMLGYAPEERTLSEETWRATVHAQDLDLLDSTLHRTLGPAQNRDEPRDVRFRVMRQDGRQLWVTSRGKVIRDANGRPLRATGVVMDITAEYIAEEALRESEDRYRQLAELSPDGILVNQDAVYVYANPSAARILGLPGPEAILGTSPHAFLDPQHHGAISSRRLQVLENNANLPPLSLPFRRGDGGIVHVQTTAGPVTWKGRPAVQVLLRDISELKDARDKLRVMSERVRLVIESAGEGIWDWEIADNSYTFSGGLKAILGYDPATEGTPSPEWSRLIHPDDLPRVYDAVKATLEDRTPVYQCEYRIRAKDGSWKWVLSRGVVVERDEHGKPAIMTGTMSDISARKEADDQSWRHAYMDALTGVPNRRHFREQLELALLRSQRSGEKTALLFIDLDRFKEVNDVFGHDAGDALLVEAVGRIRGCVRQTDLTARLGGDEFIVMLNQFAELKHVEFTCDSILEALGRPFQVGAESVYVSASIGVALFPHDACEPDDLVRRADQAMYAAKKNGRNQFCFFTAAMDQKAHLRLRLSNELRHALDGGQLEVHYQPVLDLESGSIVKAEALLRWRHPELGVVEPSVFIPIAEEAGLIGRIGDWVFQQAGAASRRWRSELGVTVQVSVNKSPLQFRTHGSDADWLRHLEQLGVPGGHIAVEITEGVLLHASPNVCEQLIKYRNAGVQVAIDDFGTGYSSMAYLQKFHIDYLKIDQSFVCDIATNAAQRTIAESIVVMAHKLGLKVIAEGVETSEQLDVLRRAGCDYGQGFYFSRPVSAAAFGAMLARQRPLICGPG